MSEFIVTNKTIAIMAVVFIIIAIMVGVISYNLGVGYGLKQNTPTAQNQNNQPTTDTTQSANQKTTNEEPETVISGEPLVTEAGTTLSGAVTAVSANGFTIESTSNTLNSQTGRLIETKTSYQVTTTSKTKITQVVSAVTIPPQGGPAQVTTSTKNATLSQIKIGNTVTIVTTSDLATKQLVATEIKITS